jgi:site-specific DNA recombinase
LAVGKKIKKAFIWKAEGMKNEEIISRLKAMGVKMYKQPVK